MNSDRTETASLLGFVLLLIAGCGTEATTGGDIPVSTERLAGCTLVDIGDNVTWAFRDDSVVIDNKGQPIPADRLGSLIAEGTMPKQIEANWQFNQLSNAIDLQNITIDGRLVEAKVSIPIRPAGQVRVNLGNDQYNMFRNAK